jgi:RNA polymerase sigma factor (sigma-70 family)
VNQLAQETYLLAGSDKQKFISVVYERYGKKLYSYAINNWKLDTDIAWDLIYKTLYKVIDSVGNYEFNSEEKFASFVFKIFINYLRNHYRDTKNEREAIQMTSLEGHDHQQMEEEKTESKQMKALNEVLMEMEDWQRMLLLMRSEGRPYSEIAKYIDKPESQLKVYYQRLKEQITKKLNERS